MAGGQLNVFLHGMWAIVSNGECIELLAPGLANHSFEVSVTPAPPAAVPALAAGSSYCLSGVARRPAAVRFPRERALVVDNLCVVNRGAVHSSVYLPHPRTADVRRTVEVDAVHSFSGSHGEKLAPKHIPLVTVLTYNYTNSTDLRLGDSALAAATDEPIGLHLFSEPGAVHVANLPARYALSAFDKFGRVFPGLDLQLVNAPWVRAKAHEECSLWERERVAAGVALADLARHPVLVSLVIENV